MVYIEIFLNTNLPIRDRHNSELNTELNRYYSAFKLNSGDHMIVCRIHTESLHSNDGLGRVNYEGACKGVPVPYGLVLIR